MRDELDQALARLKDVRRWCAGGVHRAMPGARRPQRKPINTRSQKWPHLVLLLCRLFIRSDPRCFAGAAVALHLWAPRRRADAAGRSAAQTECATSLARSPAGNGHAHREVPSFARHHDARSALDPLSSKPQTPIGHLPTRDGRRGRGFERPDRRDPSHLAQRRRQRQSGLNTAESSAWPGSRLLDPIREGHRAARACGRCRDGTQCSASLPGFAGLVCYLRQQFAGRRTADLRSRGSRRRGWRRCGRARGARGG